MEIQIVKGRRTLNASTCQGHRGDALRSFLQKAIRRGEEDNAMKAAAALYALGTQESKEHPRESKMFLTNLMNRLLIIMVEDVGIAQPDIVTQAQPLFQMASEGVVQPWAVANLVRMMCGARKIRLLSDWGIMWKPDKVERIRGDPEFGPLYFARYEMDYHKELREMEPGKLRDVSARQIVEVRHWIMRNAGSDMWILKYVERIIYLVAIGDHLAMYYAMVYFVHNPTWKLRGSIDNRKKPIYLLFRVLENFMRKMHESFEHLLGGFWADQIRALENLHRSHSSHKEAPLLLLNAMLYCLDRDKFVDLDLWASSHPKIDKSLGLPSLPHEFSLSQYAYDKHTDEGRRAGKNGEEFAISGALVTNEAEHLVDPVLRRLYHRLAISKIATKRVPRHPWTLKPAGNWSVYGSLKPIPNDESSGDTGGGGCGELEKERGDGDGGGSRPSKRQKMDVCPLSCEYPRESIMMHPFEATRIQVLTSKAKPDVYLSGNGMFVKGPYASEDKCLVPLELNNKIKLAYCGLNTVPNMRVEYWVPDLLSDNPPNFGVRTKIEPGRAYPFVVMDDLDWKAGQKPYPTRFYGKDDKLWTSQTLLVDMSQARLRHLNLMDFPKALYDQLWSVLIFRYIFQITDTCERNILIQDGARVYSVDEESFAQLEHPIKSLFKKPLTGKRLSAMVKIMKETDWKPIKTRLLDWLASDEKMPAHVKERLNKIVHGHGGIQNELRKLL